MLRARNSRREDCRRTSPFTARRQIIQPNPEQKPSCRLSRSRPDGRSRSSGPRRTPRLCAARYVDLSFDEIASIVGRIHCGALAAAAPRVASGGGPVWLQVSSAAKSGRRFHRITRRGLRSTVAVRDPDVRSTDRLPQAAPQRSAVPKAGLAGHHRGTDAPPHRTHQRNCRLRGREGSPVLRFTLQTEVTSCLMSSAIQLASLTCGLDNDGPSRNPY